MGAPEVAGRTTCAARGKRTSWGRRAGTCHQSSAAGGARLHVKKPASPAPPGRVVMRHTASLRRCALALIVLAGGCRSPAADAAVAEQLAQMSDALVGMRDQVAVLSNTVDSLVIVAARQDSLIKRLAATSGAP